jgi:hypothetical protein
MDSKSFRQETAKTLLFRVEIEFGAKDRFIEFYRGFIHLGDTSRR